MRSFDPGSALGPRLREVREQRGLSVRELARRAGCSASLVSQIERGVSTPSSGMIYLLAVELRASLDYLFDAAPPAGPELEPAAATIAGRPLVTRAAEPGGAAQGQPVAPGPVAGPDAGVLPGHGVVQRVSSRRVIDLASGVRWERLTPDADSRVDFLEVIYEPGGRSMDAGRPVRHDGYEYGVIISGRLRADVGFEVCHLDTGDSIAFPSTTPHQYWNESAEPVRAIWAVVHSQPGLA
jgi:transcriptional regulator with XRE-family HTH domain/mannose-6-phosphate isomerase-like protein (cupin superfamily)